MTLRDEETSHEHFLVTLSAIFPETIKREVSRDVQSDLTSFSAVNRRKKILETEKRILHAEI
jgi:hypothetical protein